MWPVPQLPARARELLLGESPAWGRPTQPDRKRVGPSGRAGRIPAGALGSCSRSRRFAEPPAGRSARRRRPDRISCDPDQQRRHRLGHCGFGDRNRRSRPSGGADPALFRRHRHHRRRDKNPDTRSRARIGSTRVFCDARGSDRGCGEPRRCRRGLRLCRGSGDGRTRSGASRSRRPSCRRGKCGRATDRRQKPWFGQRLASSGAVLGHHRGPASGGRTRQCRKAACRGDHVHVRQRTGGIRSPAFRRSVRPRRTGSHSPFIAVHIQHTISLEDGRGTPQ